MKVDLDAKVVDIAPTVLKCLGFPKPGGMEGESLI